MRLTIDFAGLRLRLRCRRVALTRPKAAPQPAQRVRGHRTLREPARWTRRTWEVAKLVAAGKLSRRELVAMLEPHQG